MTDMSSLCNLTLIERMENIYLQTQIEVSAISILCTGLNLFCFPDNLLSASYCSFFQKLLVNL